MLALNQFDQQLRTALGGLFGSVEIAQRARIGETLGRRDPQAHLRPDFLQGGLDPAAHKHFHTEYKNVVKWTKDPVIQRYAKEYGTDELPLWIGLEGLNLGLLIQLYRFMSRPLRQEVADAFDASAKELGSWLRRIRELRNLSAHHQVIWNARTPSPVRTTERRHCLVLQHLEQGDTRTYLTVAVANFLAKQVQDFAAVEATRSALLQFPDVLQFDVHSLGAPYGWEHTSLWHV
ncbi:hypothetical protein GCM10011359_15390 [Nesterenkonia alkaliphila]|nr:hypothetical protein GCM10011359_15390 [Nesterenkonia alkaliphila]